MLEGGSFLLVLLFSFYYFVIYFSSRLASISSVLPLLFLFCFIYPGFDIALVFLAITSALSRFTRQ